MVNAQGWLESQEEYNTKEKREQITELYINYRELTGSLNLSDFVNLEKINCSHNLLTDLRINNCLKLKKFWCDFNKLTSLNLSGLEELKEIWCNDNYLTSFDYSVLNSNKLIHLDIANNNLPKQDLSIFSKFTNLETLRVSGNNKERFAKNIYNKFYGSLEPLKHLNKLKNLDISNTDINSGLEYLPTSVVEKKRIHCFRQVRPESKIKEIVEQLQWINKYFSAQQLKSWIDFGFRSEDYGLASYLTKQGYHPNSNFNLEELRKNYQKSQGWLDKNYPKEERWLVSEIYVNEPNLEGELDLSDFTSHWGAKVYISSLIEESKITFKNLPKEAKIIKCVVAQKWLDFNYPVNGVCQRINDNWLTYGEKVERWNNFGKTREEITKLRIGFLNLEGCLDLSGFVNLKELNCWYNKLTSLNVSNCYQLEKIDCSDNLLTSLNLPANLTNLRELILKDNNFPEQDLSFLKKAINLEKLCLGNWDEKKILQNLYNRFTGSLDYCSGMKKLKKLDISDTDFNQVNIEKLPKSLERISLYPLSYGFNSADKFTTYRINCQLTIIVDQLEKIRHGFCSKCQQPRVREDWCQYCVEQEWEQELRQLPSQEFVEKFIQQQKSTPKYNKLGARVYNEYSIKLEWIPYEKFSEIEYLAEGGFSKIYKAKCKEIKKHHKFSSQVVVLKIINNLQNITLDFLTEVFNTKLADNDNGVSFPEIVPFYGISQDPVSKDYVMVMQYMKGGNLRECLQNKFAELILEDKLSKQLIRIILGLKDIHDQNLVHRDLHSGNILNSDLLSYITDLGLCQPANYQPDKGQIFGVLPYVAPEVLQGKPYTQKSDIYSFGIVAYELLANSYPYQELSELSLTLKICQGLRPNIEKLSIPQLLKNLIKKCWDADPKQRPTAEELYETIHDWWWGKFGNEKDTQFRHQYNDLKEEYNSWSQNTPYQIHPQAVVTSKLINTQQITQLLEKFQASKDLDLDINNFLNSKEIKRTKRQLSLSAETPSKRKEIKLDTSNWTNVHPNFTPKLIQSWIIPNFTSQQVKEWLDIGLTINDVNFCVWLRDTKQLTPEQVINHGNLLVLRTEYLNSQQLITQMEIPPQQN